MNRYSLEKRFQVTCFNLFITSFRCDRMTGGERDAGKGGKLVFPAADSREAAEEDEGDV